MSAKFTRRLKVHDINQSLFSKYGIRRIIFDGPYEELVAAGGTFTGEIVGNLITGDVVLNLDGLKVTPLEN